MTTFHQLSPALRAAVASGGGGPAAVRDLRAAQLSKHLLLIRHLLAQWPDAAGEPSAIMALLDRVRTEAPDVFRDVVGAPLVGAWAAIVTRAVRQGGADPADFRHLGALAGVACAAAGLDGRVAVAVQDGLVVLPGLGAAVVPAPGPAEIVVAAGRVTVRSGTATVPVPDDPTAAGRDWLPVRRLRAEAAGLGFAPALDDLHPYRHGHHVPPANRLSAAEIKLWQATFEESWQLLAERLPDRAAELRVGLRTLVPLVRDDNTARSATLRHAFGVFGLTRPATAADFAVTMVHEFQHSKLSAVLDLTRLTRPDDTGRYFAPWRTDPRPLPGLLQGVYAFVGVADTCRALRAAPGIEQLAEKRFVAARLQVDRGLTAVENSGGLTAEGEHFVAGLRAATDVLLSEPAAPEIVRAAEAALAHTHRMWQEQFLVRRTMAQTDDG